MWIVYLTLFYRLCIKDAHQLFQRLESHARDYILEVKVRLLQQLTSGHNTPEQAKAFVLLMLQEYASLCLSAKILSEIFNKLVSIPYNIIILLFVPWTTVLLDVNVYR